MANFALIGAAGYIAPRHLKAIADTDNNLVVAFDKSDNVGRLDSSFPDCAFFMEQEDFEDFCNSVKGTPDNIDWLSICTPNHTHDALIRYGLQMGADVICEKPVVLTPSALEELMKVEEETGHHAYTILQLRLHESIIALKKKIDEGPTDKVYDIDLTYITSRGKWYYASWKGNDKKSGGVAADIGIHFYDMLQWIFGPVQENIVHIKKYDRVAGYLRLKKARVRYFLSTNAECLPEKAVQEGKKTYRTLMCDGSEFEFSDGFADLHTENYSKILNGNGFRISEAMPSIKIIDEISKATPVGLVGDYHPLAES